jgi:hypothetical protein
MCVAQSLTASLPNDWATTSGGSGAIANAGDYWVLRLRAFAEDDTSGGYALCVDRLAVQADVEAEALLLVADA